MGTLSNILVQVEFAVHRRLLSGSRQETKDQGNEKTPPLTPEHVKKDQ